MRARVGPTARCDPGPARLPGRAGARHDPRETVSNWRADSEAIGTPASLEDDERRVLRTTIEELLAQGAALLEAIEGAADLVRARRADAALARGTPLPPLPPFPPPARTLRGVGGSPEHGEA
jgi:hypothetical protein